METLTRVLPISLTYACLRCEMRILLYAPPVQAYSQLHRLMEQHEHQRED